MEQLDRHRHERELRRGVEFSRSTWNGRGEGLPAYGGVPPGARRPPIPGAASRSSGALRHERPVPNPGARVAEKTGFHPRIFRSGCTGFHVERKVGSGDEASRGGLPGRPRMAGSGSTARRGASRSSFRSRRNRAPASTRTDCMTSRACCSTRNWQGRGDGPVGPVAPPRLASRIAPVTTARARAPPRRTADAPRNDKRRACPGLHALSEEAAGALLRKPRQERRCRGHAGSYEEQRHPTQGSTESPRRSNEASQRLDKERCPSTTEANIRSDAIFSRFAMILDGDPTLHDLGKRVRMAPPAGICDEQVESAPDVGQLGDALRPVRVRGATRSDPDRPATRVR